jgi:hypothetical protein
MDVPYGPRKRMLFGLCRKVCTVGVAVLLALCAPWLHAGAWTPAAGHGQIILTSSLYRTSTTFDSKGNLQNFDYAGQYRQFINSAYIECGLSKRDSFTLNVPGEMLEFKNNYGKMQDAGIGDVEVAWKRRLNPLESKWVLSSQFLVMFPGYSPTQNPAPGNHQEDLEARLMLGHGGSIAKQHIFWDVEAAYRYRNGAPADQFRSDATVGIEFGHRLMAMGQAFAIKGMQNGQPVTANSNPNLQSDFDLYKVQPSLVLTMFHSTRLQGGWNDAFLGRNTGNGHSVILAVWTTF